MLNRQPASTISRTPTQATTRTARALIGALLIGALFAAAVAPAAHAGRWVRTFCVAPDGSAAGSDGWLKLELGDPGASAVYGLDCGPGRPMQAGLRTVLPAPARTAAMLHYAPPEGSTLAGGTLTGAVHAQGYGYHALGTAAIMTPQPGYDAANVIYQCVALLGCTGAPVPSSSRHDGAVELPSAPATLPPGSVATLTLMAACAGEAGRICNTDASDGWWSLIALTTARLVLDADATPTASGFAGSVLEKPAHGTASLTFTAEERTGPGIFNVTAQIDGETVYSATPNANGGKCRSRGTDAATGLPTFAWQQPCPLQTAVALSLRTTLLRDGEHRLRVTVSDAAQNTSTVLDEQITVDNRTTVSARGDGEEPVGGATTIGAPYTIALDRGTRALRRGLRRTWARSALTLSGTLQNATGAPAAGVPISVSAKSAGQRPSVIETASTDATGHWVLRVPRGPSRLLTISAGPQGQAAIRIRQTVRPGVSLQVRTLGGGRLAFTGRVRANPLGSPGPLVIIEVRPRDGRRWQTVGSPARVDGAGRYRLAYNGGRAIVGGHYQFRAVAPATRLYASATSPIASILAR